MAITDRPDKTTAVGACSVVVRDVSFSSEGTDILRGISFDTDMRRVGIVGRNGSGKTTLARMLAGLIEPTSGEVLIDGCNVAKDRKTAVRTVGILFQNPDHQIIFPTVSEEIEFGLLQLGKPKDVAATEAARILADFNKSHWAEAAVHTLSQGQRHLVCLMAVLAMSPKVIILDEPFAGLDIPTTRQLTRYLDAVDASLIHVSHDPATLARYDRVLWIDAGQVEMDGDAADVLPVFTERMEQIGGGDDLSLLSG